MRALKCVVLASLVGLAWVGCALPQTEQPLVRLEVPDDPTITFKVWVRAGSWNDPAGREGLAGLTGQLIEEGATENNSYEEILARLYPMASSYGVSVDREMTVLTGRTHRDNLDAFLELFTDAYLRPAFNEDDFKRLKTDTLNYLENTLRYSQDEELAKAALVDDVFGGTPYAHPTAGTVEGVRAITLDDVREFYRRFYTPRNTVLAIGGGFDEALTQRFLATLEQLPGSNGQASAAAPPALEIAPLSGRSVLLVDKPDADASISFGFPIDVRRGEKDFYALWLANSWLGEHRNSSSHLFQVIREKRGMNYGDYSYIEAFPNGGRRSFPPNHAARSKQLFEVWIRTLPNEQAVFALRAALREVQRLVDEGMTAETFELTREFLKKYSLHFADTTTARLGYAVDDRFYGIDGAGHLARFREMMDTLTLEDVNGAIRRHLQVDNLKIAIVTGDAAALREALVSDAATPMTYQSVKPQDVLEADEEIAVYPLKIDASAVQVVPLAEMFQD